MTEMIVYLTLFLIVWFVLGFIGAGWDFAYWTKKYTKGMLQLHKETAIDWYKQGRKDFFLRVLSGFVSFMVCIEHKQYRSYGWMFPWSKKTKDYLGIE
jgi:hypothetical protein